MDNSEKKIAIFDFDKTLRQGFLSKDFFNYLKDEKAPLNYDSLNLIDKLNDAFEQELIKPKDFIKQMGELKAQAFKGFSMIDGNMYALNFVAEDLKKNLYSYTEQLLNTTKEAGYTNIILSLGPGEVIDKFKKYLSIDEVYASRLQIFDWKYTGKMRTDMHEKGGKRRELHQIIKKGYNLEKSLGFGDSFSDEEFLEMVDYPYVLNPNLEFKKRAEEKAWPIFNNGSIVDVVKEKLEYIS